MRDELVAPISEDRRDALAARLEQIKGMSLPDNERIQAHLAIAFEYEEAGEYEAASEVLGRLRLEDDESDDIDDLTRADIFLRLAIVGGWIFPSPEGQEQAKNLISMATAIFEGHSYEKKIAECHVELAVCYWRAGDFDNARAMLSIALSHLPTDSPLKAKAILRAAIVERSEARYSEALRILDEAAPLFERVRSDVLRGCFHGNRALALRNLGESDRALIEYAAASDYLDRAGHDCYRARVENNLGFLLFKLGRFSEAHTHLDTARSIFQRLGLAASCADVDDTRAQALLAEGRNQEAVWIAREACRVLAETNERAKHAEALTTLAVALARSGQTEEARGSFNRAIDEATQAGAMAQAERSARSLAEELRLKKSRRPASAGKVRIIVPEGATDDDHFTVLKMDRCRTFGFEKGDLAVVLITSFILQDDIAVLEIEGEYICGIFRKVRDPKARPPHQHPFIFGPFNRSEGTCFGTVDSRTGELSDMYGKGAGVIDVLDSINGRSAVVPAEIIGRVIHFERDGQIIHRVNGLRPLREPSE